MLSQLMNNKEVELSVCTKGRQLTIDQVWYRLGWTTSTPNNKDPTSNLYKIYVMKPIKNPTNSV